MELKDQKSWSTGDTSTSQKTCPSCGAEVDKSSVMCPICGEPVVKKSSFDSLPFGGSSGFGSSDSSSSYMELSPSKKSSSIASKIIALLVVVTLAFVGFMVYKTIFKYDGKYYFKSVILEGQPEVTVEMMKLYGVDMSGMYIKIHGNKATLSGGSSFGFSGGTLDTKVKNGKMEMTGTGGEKITGTIDGNRLTLNMVDEEGTSGALVFEKK